MIIQNKANPKVINEVSKKEWESLGASQKAFKILDPEDSKSVKEQIIISSVGKKEPTEEKKKKK